MQEPWVSMFIVGCVFIYMLIGPLLPVWLCGGANSKSRAESPTF